MDQHDPFVEAMEAFERFRNAGQVYSEQLAHHQMVVLPVKHAVKQQQMHRDMRAALVAFVEFTTTLDRNIGRERLREAMPGIDYWIGYPGYEGQVHSLLNTSCDCCAGPLYAHDPLGREQYMIGPFQQACRACMEVLQLAYPQTPARVARLRAIANQNPHCLAKTIVNVIEAKQEDLDLLALALNLSPLQLIQLCSFPASILDDWSRGIAFLAAVLPCDADKLQAVLKQSERIKE